MAEGPQRNEPNRGSTRVKRQHYVPRAYLRPFLDPAEKLRVVDLDAGKEYRTCVENAAVESSFYDLDIEGVRHSTEDWLAQLEGKATPIVQHLITAPEDIGALTPPEEVSLARFITALRFRTPAFRQWENKIAGEMVTRLKEKARSFLHHKYDLDEAEAIWRKWGAKPNHWWMRREAPPQPAEGTTHMLAEVEGFANLLRAMPWRIGRTDGTLQLYTSDNPVSAYLSPVRPWWDGGMFASFTYYVPLAPSVLLRIDRRPYDDDDRERPIEPQGEREFRDFSDWEVSIARHVVTTEAARFLYGEGLVVSRDCARDCLERIGRANVEIAMKYQGFDPRPPEQPEDE